MTTRREILVGGVTMPALIGCAGAGEDRVQVSLAGLPPVPVDIHNHIFNATDIPIAGFAEQVFLRSHGTPVSRDTSLTRSLIQLVVDIVLAAKDTPTAADELKDLAGRTRLPMRDGGDLLAQDRRAVQQGLQVLEDKVSRAQARRFSLSSASGVQLAQNGDEKLFAVLSVQSGAPQSSFAPQGEGLGGTKSRAGRIAAAIYNDVDQEAASTFTTLAQAETPDQSFAQDLRWAGLLTRSRVDILGELIRLYGHRSVDARVDDPKGSNGIKIFSPSLVDFTYWLGAADIRDPNRDGHEILDQMALLSRIAKLERGAVLLPFAPFCPLRAAVYRKSGQGDWLAQIRKAVEFDGFAGIKLYPPMGFLPLGNATLQDLPRALQTFGISGQEIDDELRALYAWCVDQDVPIKAHGNNSLGADACTGQNAAAKNWAPVLNTAGWGTLRLNIAHFGGFEEARLTPDKDCPAQDITYEAQAAKLIEDFPNVYVDFGYWTEVTGTNADNLEPRLTVLNMVKAQLAGGDRLKTRLMYGSDWSMIGREQKHANYYKDVVNALKEIDLIAPEQVAILGANALRYLGLDRRGKQYDRLKRALGDTPQFAVLLKLIAPPSNFAAAARDLFSGR